MVVNVQFSDENKLSVISYFSDVQSDLNIYPNQGEIEVSDERWKQYYDSQPAFVQLMIPTL